MKTVTKHVWINGELVDEKQATVSVFDHGLLYGDGVFEGIRVYGGRVFKLASHLRRLDESARAIRLEPPYNDEQLTSAIHKTVHANGLDDGYIRLCVTRGTGTLGLNPFNCTKPCTFIIADSITLYPQKQYEEGMSIITSSVIRNHPSAISPRIKSLNYLNNILAKAEAIDAGMLEAVMLNHQGFVAECTGDNIFIAKNTGSNTPPLLITPPLHAGILEGVTRNTVIQLAHETGYKVLQTDLTKHDLYTANEIFLTGTAAEVIPVTAVDGRQISDGKPGEVTRALINAFRQLVENNAPED